MKWDSENWNNVVLNHEVLVMTPQILLNLLQHAMLKMESIKVLVFDECHHCQKNHPYARIMEEFYFKMEASKRPRVLGMTASPVIRKGKSKFQCIQDINALECMLDSKVVTVENRTELNLVVPKPVLRVKEYYDIYCSWDNIQSIAKMIETVKTKVISCTDKSRDETWKEEWDVLGRLCRDLEYCIYDLGLWFARNVISDNYNFGDASVQTSETKVQGAKQSFLTELYGYLNHILLQGGYTDELRSECLKPDFVSTKVSALVDVLSNFRHSRKNSSSRTQMLKVLDEFRSGSVDILIATNVAEEGVDIQDCCLVIRFDIPKNLRSFIQSRGRARIQHSAYIVLVNKNNVSEQLLLDTLISSEEFMIEKIASAHDSPENPLIREEIDAYKVESTGAVVNSHSSIQLLYHYCSKLPGDQFYHPQPLFVYVKEHDGVKCCLTLPSNACIRLVEGDICGTEASAKQAVCLKACKLLHLKGGLTDHLLPLSSTIEPTRDGVSYPEYDKAEMEDLQEVVIPNIWSKRPSYDCGLTHLYAYKITFKAICDLQKYSTFALLVSSPLPGKAAKLNEEFHLRQSRAVYCEVTPVEDIFLDLYQVMEAEEFQLILFSVLIDRSVEQPQKRENLMKNGPWYLLVPLKEEGISLGQGPEIDWERISQVRAFEGSKSQTSSENETSYDAGGSILQFINCTVPVKDISGLLLKTVKSKTLYSVAGIFEDLDADSPFPSERFESYIDYFRKKYSYEIVHRKQHLIEARFLRKPHNFLIPKVLTEAASDLSCKDIEDSRGDVSESTKRSFKQERYIVELPPEVCIVEYSGFHEDLINSAVILPSLMHRIESIVVATELHDFLSSRFHEGSAVSFEKVLEAITTRKCLDTLCLERLETLGDSFLKYAVSRSLFLNHPEADEGCLSLQRVNKVCNAMLFALAKRIGLAGYIRDTLFDPAHWLAPCHPAKYECNEHNARDMHGISSKDMKQKPAGTCSKNHRWIQRKTVADAIEALIGAYLEDGGEHAALGFMNFIGLNVSVNSEQIDVLRFSSQINLPLTKRINIEAIEKLLSYKFIHRGILIEAYTHASFAGHLGKCYQRLEFLGDSVLDYLVTLHLYKQFRDAGPGLLTDLRSAIVSNESFARIVIEKELYVYLIQDSIELSQSIKEFISNISVTEHQSRSWDTDKCPKVLGDILESLSGAISLDCGFDLDSVWQVFAPLMEPLIKSGRIEMHPVRELAELCQKHHFPSDSSFQRNGNQCQYRFEVKINDRLIEGTAKCKDKRSSKNQAALNVLLKMKDLGYVHPKSIYKLEALGDDDSTSLIKAPDDVSDNYQEDMEVLVEELSQLGSTQQDTELDHMNRENPVSFDDPVEELKPHVKMISNSCNFMREEMKGKSMFDNMKDGEKAAQKGGTCAYNVDLERTLSSHIDVKIDQARKRLSPGGAPNHESSSDSRVNAKGTPLAHLGHRKFECSEPDDGREQSPKGMYDGECSSTFTYEPHEVFQENVNYIRENEYSQQALDRSNHIYEHSNIKDNKESKQDAEDPDYLPVSLSVTEASAAVEMCSKGFPRMRLNETCRRNRWNDPLFTCSKIEGPEHYRWFTYDVILLYPNLGEVRCTGDPRRTKKAAMDSAAAELMLWLESSGYLSSIPELLMAEL
ncbi:hypothetical protein KP509_01G108700 [Ceratopteris richardii]|uniref:Uncharacterized protein n=1 Tax=Ceratopteris richardii TaxID=49495 RepID=A0A8T2VK61_CERRI|nr:hypothetical protein KP509_01G108700 [Ceratopteris richardii]